MYHTAWAATSSDSKLALHYMQDINAPLQYYDLHMLERLIVTSILIHIERLFGLQ